MHHARVLNNIKCEVSAAFRFGRSLGMWLWQGRLELVAAVAKLFYKGVAVGGHVPFCTAKRPVLHRRTACFAG